MEKKPHKVLLTRDQLREDLLGCEKQAKKILLIYVVEYGVITFFLLFFFLLSHNLFVPILFLGGLIPFCIFVLRPFLRLKKAYKTGHLAMKKCPFTQIKRVLQPRRNRPGVEEYFAVFAPDYQVRILGGALTTFEMLHTPGDLFYLFFLSEKDKKPILMYSTVVYQLEGEEE